MGEVLTAPRHTAALARPVTAEGVRRAADPAPPRVEAETEAAAIVEAAVPAATTPQEDAPAEPPPSPNRPLTAAAHLMERMGEAL